MKRMYLDKKKKNNVNNVGLIRISHDRDLNLLRIKYYIFFFLYELSFYFISFYFILFYFNNLYIYALKV
jgi:hypothetical protein